MLTTLLNTVDWDGHDRTEFSTLLLNLESSDEQVRATSLEKLSRLVAPWEIIEGYSTSDQAEQLISLGVQHQIISILIYLLKNSKYADKPSIIQLLHDLYRLGDVGEVYGYSTDKWDELKPITQQIRSAIRESKPLFEHLSNSRDAKLTQISKDILTLMNTE